MSIMVLVSEWTQEDPITGLSPSMDIPEYKGHKIEDKQQLLLGF